MRNAFAAEITALAAEDPRLVFLSGDIGNRLFDKLKEKAPSRFFNCGVAEANMVGVAAGLAAGGLRPVVYTITPFVTTRCLEQIRVDVCYHGQPVVLVGVGAGLSYAPLGATHHSCEDVAFLRALPGMTVLCPGDAWEVRAALRAALKRDGPVYIRIGKKGEPVVHEKLPEFAIGRWLTLRAGRDVCLLGCGLALPLALEAAKLLEARGVSTQVMSAHTVKPLDEKFLAEAFARFKTVITIEEHSRVGGFGGATAEWLADHPGLKARLLRAGTGDKFLHVTGETDYARARFGLTAAGIAAMVP